MEVVEGKSTERTEDLLQRGEGSAGFGIFADSREFLGRGVQLVVKPTAAASVAEIGVVGIGRRIN
jgi:hypothetical protein